jgi:predicted phosphodiesterase
MKILLGSDLHIEFGQLKVTNAHAAEVLILSGDIVAATDLRNWSPGGIIPPMEKAQRFMTFFEQCSASFKHVLYIMGNHEHYYGDYATSADTLRSVLEEFPNIHFMDKESITIDDVTFIGGTLWTDMNKEDPHTLYAIKGIMNDFRIIKNSSRVVSFKDEDNRFHQRIATFCPEDTVEDHKAMLAFIDETTKDKTNKFVVVGHHSPSKASTHPRYRGEALMNGAYSSDLSEFILDRPQIKLWTHGHTHDPYDYMIGSTRIVCNPRGYINYEECADNFEFKLLEV